jgi:hypothetical protein
MNNTFYELAMWQQKWCMDNLPPLPITTWVSPHYDPYEIDPSHYTDFYEPITHNQSIQYIYQEPLQLHYESESDSEDDFY